ncbi:hypothetical protein JCM14722_11300 [Pseudodesulfovibrio portus]|uniref:Uncharacterized protein n=2 Tax=Pseudodesulfovibrio portus TaxID=231439 RepID=A0ABN6RVB1_9BACT|nr:hypothetical protein JCM14722_11300 [Pseudodesulfovibrio portus]
MKGQAEASRARAYSSSHSKPTSSNEIIGEILLFTGEAALNYFLWDSGNTDLDGSPPPDWFKRD